MIPKRPYLLRAFYDWLIDSQYTPYILVDATAKDVTVPQQHINDGHIVLNLNPGAIRDFMMDNDAISFSARFSGVAFYVYCPIPSILAIYAREAPEEGIHFPDEYAQQDTINGEVNTESSTHNATSQPSKQATAASETVREKHVLKSVGTAVDTDQPEDKDGSSKDEAEEGGIKVLKKTEKDQPKSTTRDKPRKKDSSKSSRPSLRVVK